MPPAAQTVQAPASGGKNTLSSYKGRTVLIFPDNDAVGKAYAEETAAALHGVADRVQLCDLSTVWPEIPEHGDISDLIARLGDEKACEAIAELATTTPEWTPAPPTDIFEEFRILQRPRPNRGRTPPARVHH